MIRMLSVLAIFVLSTSVVAQEVKPSTPKQPPPAAPTTTLDCLQAAYNGESSAHARYVEFAKKADEEGYAGVACLFRAAARAEEIHASSHADVMKKLGATPQASLEKPDVKSTKENLAAAIKSETYEQDTMYLDFIKVARADRNSDAVRTFNYAKAVEGGHAKLYQEAYDHLDQWKAKGDFFVCLVCGNTVTTVDFARCPVCFSPKEKYELVK